MSKIVRTALTICEGEKKRLKTIDQEQKVEGIHDIVTELIQKKHFTIFLIVKRCIL